MNTHSKDPNPPRDGSSDVRSALLCFALCSAVCLLFFFPGAITWIWAPTFREDLGIVHSSRYVGGIRYTTEFTTVSPAAAPRQFLLSGVVNIPAGTALEKREHFFARQVCIQGSDACWELLGN